MIIIIIAIIIIITIIIIIIIVIIVLTVVMMTALGTAGSEPRSAALGLDALPLGRTNVRPVAKQGAVTAS